MRYGAYEVVCLCAFFISASSTTLNAAQPPDSPKTDPAEATGPAPWSETGYDGHYSCDCYPELEEELCIAVSDQEPEEVERLLRAGAKINARSTSPLSKDMTILLLAVWHKWHIEAVSLAISAGADVNAQDARGDNALVLATKKGPDIDPELVSLLLGAGADVNSRGWKQVTPLMCAATHHSPEVVRRLLVRGANVGARDKNGWTALLHATRPNAGNAANVKMLIEAGANVNVQHQQGGTPLNSAAYNGHAEVTQLLISAGANVNARDAEGWTPLICAACNGHLEIVKLLVAKGAEVNARNRIGFSALSLARIRGHQETVEYLVQVGEQ